MMTDIIYCNEDSCWYLIYWSNNPTVPVKGYCRLFIKYAISLLCMIFSIIVWCMLKMRRFPCTGNGFNVDICHMEIFVLHQMVLVLAVWVSVSGLFRKSWGGGGGEITTVDIAFIVSIPCPVFIWEFCHSYFNGLLWKCITFNSYFFDRKVKR